MKLFAVSQSMKCLVWTLVAITKIVVVANLGTFLLIPPYPYLRYHFDPKSVEQSEQVPRVSVSDFEGGGEDAVATLKYMSWRLYTIDV